MKTEPEITRIVTKSRYTKVLQAPHLKTALRFAWIVSLVIPFFIIKWWSALLIIALVFLAPGAFLGISLTKQHSQRLGMVKTTLLESFIEGGVFVLILSAIDILSYFTISLETVLLGVWLYTINQLNRAARSSDVAVEESLPIPGFLIGAFIALNLWIFVLSPFALGY